MDDFSAMDGCESESPIRDDLCSFSALMSLDSYTELCSPNTAEQMFSSLAFLSTSPTLPAKSNDAVTLESRNDLQFDWSTDTLGIDVDNSFNSLVSHNDVSVESTSIVPRHIGGLPLQERMLKTLSLLKELFCHGTLAQVWMPIRKADQWVLSTAEQPYLLDQRLGGFREVSRHFTFSAKEVPGFLPGLPGRVYISGVPEWTSNVRYYKRDEYLRVEHAIDHQVRGSLAVPVFYASEVSCCAVLELVMTREKCNFDLEMDNICNALQSVNLRTTKAQQHRQILAKNQKSAFSEILDVLRAACCAHMLPLALTWAPCFKGDGDISGSNSDGAIATERRKDALRVQESASFVNDQEMHGFLDACSEHFLEKGQGIAGKALISNHPFFSPDVKAYSICDYPLAHHARKFGLHAAVAIRLRSTYTGIDDYILEFFLPASCRDSEEQQLLLNDLSNTMQRNCRSLRSVSDSEIAGHDVSGLVVCKDVSVRSLSSDIVVKSSYHMDRDEPTRMTSLEEYGKDAHHQGKASSMRHPERKHNTAEKNISLSVLQQYFYGSLKDAAKSIGVCPTTLKKICRQHGISRWPSRKIKKVNRSLQKIQTVINSVQGVEGTLRFDPTTGCLVTAVSSPEKPATLISDITSRESVTNSSSQLEKTVVKLQPTSFIDRHCKESPHNTKCEEDEFGSLSNTSNSMQSFYNDQGELQNSITQDTVKWSLCPEDISHSSYITSEAGNFGGQNGPSSPTLISRSLIPSEGEKNKLLDDNDAITEHSDPTSGVTNYSSSSASIHSIFKCPTNKGVVSENIAAYTVKATYNGDIVRLKFIPSMGYHYLLEEVRKRFRLPAGLFQLHYLDDEDEWVMLTNDLDLQECLEVLECIGSHSIKLQVRDVPCAGGSSSSSNYLK